MPKLVLKNKAEVLLELILVKDGVTIGRSEKSDIVIDDRKISLLHCEIKGENGKFVIYDSKTAYGTFVNGERINSKALKIGDEIKIGDHKLMFRDIKPREEDPSKKRYYLIGIYGPFEGKKFELTRRETRIGRGEEYNDLVLSGDLDPSVSRRHATINFSQDRYELIDRRSRNRTFINKKETGEDETIPLQLKDEILIGHSIFRFVEEGNEDYSPPKKAGMIWVRLAWPLQTTLGTIVVLAGLLGIITGVLGIFTVISKPSPLRVQPLPWNVQISNQDIKSTLEEYDITPSPAIGDIDGNGMPDIVLPTTTGNLYAWHSRKGDLLWPEPAKIGERIISSPAIIDVNNDSAQDIIINSDQSRIFIIDGLSGKLIYKSGILGGNLTSSPAVGDINGDGTIDIVTCAEEGMVYFIYSPVTNPQIEFAKVTGELFSSPAIFQDEEKRLVVVGTSLGRLFIFDGQTRRTKVLNITEAINKLLGTHLPINEITPTPAIGDLNGDKVPEIVIATNQYYVGSINSRGGQLLWAKHIEPISEKDSPTHYSSPVLVDIDGDQKLDIILASCNGRVLGIRGIDGEILWEYNTGGANRIISSPALADFDKDGVPDILIGNEDGKLYLISGKSKLPQNSDRLLANPTVASAPLTSSPVIGDVNNDGLLEIVYSSINNKPGILATNTKTFKGKILWAMFHKDAQRTGRFLYKLTLKPFLLRILISLVVICIVSLFFSLRKQKRLSRRVPVLPKNLKIK